MEKLIASLSEVDTKSADIKVSGSTVAICLIRPGPVNGSRHLFVANVGDTRVVLASKGGKAERLTEDHNTDNPNEIKRIEAAGGFILRGRILGILSVARAIGDHTMKKYVISQPNTRQFEITGEHEFIIIACDGVWDVVEDQEAVELIKTGIAEEKCTEQDAAQFLIDVAMEKGSQDNITVLVVFF